MFKLSARARTDFSSGTSLNFQSFLIMCPFNAEEHSTIHVNKPNSVAQLRAGRQLFISFQHCCRNLAVYPKVCPDKSGGFKANNLVFRKRKKPSARPCTKWGLPCSAKKQNPKGTSGITTGAVSSYLAISPLLFAEATSGIFSVVLSVSRFLDPGRYPALCSTEFGLSSIHGETP